MDKVMVTYEHLTAIADAIRRKLGNKKTYKPVEMAPAIEEIKAGADAIDMTKLAERTYSFGNYIAEETTINSMLYSSQNIQTYRNENLTAITIANAFNACYQLESFIAPNLTSFNNKGGTFSGNQRLRTVDIGSITELPASTFWGCGQLPYIPNADILTYIANQCFSYNAAIKVLNLPMVKDIGAFAFAVCPGLTDIVLPSIIKLQGNVFSQSHNIANVDLGENCTFISRSAFFGSKINVTLTVRAKTPPTLDGIVVLGAGGSVKSIRVPKESIDAYKTASNWSTYSNIIEAI